MQQLIPQPLPVVNTAKVVGRRKLQFSTLDDIAAEAERLSAGRVRQLGNWSVGQATAHLARTMRMSLDGDPARAPWPIRMLLKLVKRHVLTKGMRPGFKLPKPAAEKYISGPQISHEQGLSELRNSIARLKAEPQRHPHPAFGPLTREEWSSFICATRRCT